MRVTMDEDSLSIRSMPGKSNGSGGLCLAVVSSPDEDSLCIKASRKESGMPLRRTATQSA